MQQNNRWYHDHFKALYLVLLKCLKLGQIDLNMLMGDYTVHMNITYNFFQTTHLNRNVIVLKTQLTDCCITFQEQVYMYIYWV